MRLVDWSWWYDSAISSCHVLISQSEDISSVIERQKMVIILTFLFLTQFTSAGNDSPAVDNYIV